MKRFLKRENNKVLYDLLLGSENSSVQIVSALKEFVTNYLKEKKTTAEKEVLFALVAACTTYLPAHVSKNKIREMLGFHTKTFYTYMRRPLNDSTTYKHISRRGRKGTDLQKLQRDCVDKFCHSDEASSFDSNSRRIVEVEKDGKLEKHFGRVWNVPTVREQ